MFVGKGGEEKNHQIGGEIAQALNIGRSTNIDISKNGVSEGG